jgi:hypothetical protein
MRQKALKKFKTTFYTMLKHDNHDTGGKDGSTLGREQYPTDRTGHEPVPRPHQPRLRPQLQEQRPFHFHHQEPCHIWGRGAGAIIKHTPIQ